MKKLIFVFMAIVAVSFASCGDKTTNDSVKVDSLDSTADTINNTVTVDSIVK